MHSLINKKFQNVLVELSPKPLIDKYFDKIISKIKQLGVQIYYNENIKY